MYDQDFITGSKTDTNAFYITSLPDSIAVYSYAANKSFTGFLYYGTGTAEGAGKIKRNTSYDVSSTSRKKVTNYEYYTGNVDYTGALKNAVFDNGLTDNYNYLPSLTGNYTLYARVVKTDSSEVDTTYSLTFNSNFYDYIQSYFENKIFDTDTLSNFRVLSSGSYNILRDQNNFIYSMALDPADRPVKITKPGFFTSPMLFGFDPLEGWIPSSSMVYNDTVGYINDTAKFTPSQSSPVMQSTRNFNYNNRQSSYLMRNDGGSMELKSSTVYNYLNEPIFDSTGTGITKYYDYDLFGRIIKTHFADGSHSTTTYQSSNGGTIGGNSYYELETDSDEVGNVKKSYFDINDNLVAEVPGTNNPTIYNYNSINQLTSVQSPGGKTTSYTYDGFGNTASKSSPDEGTYKYKYDVYGNLRFTFHTTETPLQTVFNSYDPMNRLLSTGIENTTASVYDTLNPDIIHSFEIDTTNFVLSNMYDKFVVSGVFPSNPYISALKNLKAKQLQRLLGIRPARDGTISCFLMII